MLPDRLRRQLEMPVMAAPMFLVSGPDLVVEAARRRTGTFPVLNQHTTGGFDAWLTDIRGDSPDRTARHLERNSSFTPPTRGTPPTSPWRSVHEVPIVITTLGIRTRVDRCRARLWRPGVPRCDHDEARQEGARRQRGRHHRGLRRCRRPRRHIQSVRIPHGVEADRRRRDQSSLPALSATANPLPAPSPPAPT